MGSKLNVEQRAKKVGGSYQAEGIIKAKFLADDNTWRYVFRFDNPPGLLHIFNEKQLEVEDDQFLCSYIP